MAADAWTRLEQRLTRWQWAAAALAALLIIGFIVAHRRDAGRDRELVALHAIIARESLERAAAVAHTDSAIMQSETAVRRSSRADSGWTNAHRAAARVPTILASTKPDTVKIRELVATVDTLRIAGDSLQRAAAADTIAIAQLRARFLVERSAAQRERDDLAKALAVSEARHRHWGLGATIGYSGIRDQAGIVRVGPGITVGATYRW